MSSPSQRPASTPASSAASTSPTALSSGFPWNPLTTVKDTGDFLFKKLNPFHNAASQASPLAASDGTPSTLASGDGEKGGATPPAKLLAEPGQASRDSTQALQELLY